MKKNRKILFWALLFVLSVIGFIASVVLKRTPTVLSFLITTLMTGWWLFVEIRNNARR